MWYLPHYPVKHPLKAKVRLVHDCAVKFGQTSLEVGDIEAMFHQFMVDPKDCDTFSILKNLYGGRIGTW